jgi:hypothetical protein
MMTFLWNAFAIIGIVASLIMLVAGYVVWETRR